MDESDRRLAYFIKNGSELRIPQLPIVRFIMTRFHESEFVEFFAFFCSTPSPHDVSPPPSEIYMSGGVVVPRMVITVIIKKRAEPSG